MTLQAFYAGKPVITAADSGGVLEWVEDGVTGLVTDGTAGRRRRRDRQARVRSATAPARLGERRPASASPSSSWTDVVERLLG